MLPSARANLMKGETGLLSGALCSRGWAAGSPLLFPWGRGQLDHAGRCYFLITVWYLLRLNLHSDKDPSRLLPGHIPGVGDNEEERSAWRGAGRSSLRSPSPSWGLDVFVSCHGLGRACPKQACHISLFQKVWPWRVQLGLLTGQRWEHMVPGDVGGEKEVLAAQLQTEQLQTEQLFPAQGQRWPGSCSPEHVFAGLLVDPQAQALSI